MSNFNWKALQNGSDIRGVALEGVSGENVNLTPDTVARLGEAFVAWLQNEATKQNCVWLWVWTPACRAPTCVQPSAGNCRVAVQKSSIAVWPPPRPCS